MGHIRLNSGNVGECASLAAEILRAGGVVLYPTDTLYGLGADALSDDAVAKVYTIKGRDGKKPVHCVVSDMSMAERYVEVNSAGWRIARKLAEKLLPGALTLILKKKKGIDGGIARDMDTVGIRIPDNEFCLALAREFGGCITTTSANKAGMETERNVEKILEQLGEASIDLVVDAGPLPSRQPSTVVDVSGKEPVILREGAISATDIQAVLTSF